MSTPYQVLLLSPGSPDLATSPFGPFVLHACRTLDEAAEALQTQTYDAVLLDLQSPSGASALLGWSGLSRAALDSAVLAVLQTPTPAHCLKLVQRGVRDILSPSDLRPDVLGRCLRLAIERKQLDDTARRAYSIDLSTGLPNRQQLQEHMTHLLALREREPAAMALIALQLDGMGAVEASMGVEAANVLRRKLAVRLRASLRASDVVASLGGDLFCVLLAWIDAQEDAERVARKLLKTVSQPYLVAGQTLPLSARLGVAQYPAHGKEARALLSRALGQVSGDGIGRQLRGAAANDEVPPAAD